MSANVPTTRIGPVPDNAAQSGWASWLVQIAQAVNFLLKGGAGTPITSVGDAAYSLLPSDRLVETSAAFTAARIWTLPAATSVKAGTEVAIIDAIATITTANTLTIALSGADTIDGTAASLILNIARSAVALVSDGLSNWALKIKVGGQFLSSTVLVGSAVALATGVGKDVTTVSLGAGDWDCYGNVVFNPAGTTTIQGLLAWMSTTANTAPTPPNSGAYTSLNASFTTGQSSALSAGRLRVSGPATVSLGAYAAFGVSTMGAYGFLGCYRVAP